MGKFIIGFNSEIASSINRSKSAGFEISGTSQVAEDIQFTSFHKLGLDNCNFLEVDKDFVCTIGTIIYRGFMEIDALSQIYNDFDGTPESIRSHVLGNGCFIIKKGDTLSVFGDDYSIFDVYYYMKDDKCFVSNSLYDVASSVNTNVIKGNLVESACFVTVYNNETVFEDIHRLDDSQMLVFDTNKGCWKIIQFDVYGPAYQSDVVDYESIVSTVAREFKQNTQIIQSKFGDPALSSTGGLDNRLNLAAFLSIGSKPVLYYGVGNSNVVGTFSAELDLNNIFVEKYGLNLNVLSRKISNPVNNDWDELIKTYGTLATMYGGSKDFYDSYKAIPEKFILFGSFGEIFRNDETEGWVKNTMSIEEFIDNCLLVRVYDLRNKFMDSVELRRRMIKRYKKICEKWGLNPNSLDLKDLLLLEVERECISDTRLLNYLNLHHYSMYTYAQRNVVRHVFNVEYKDKAKSKFQLDIIKNIYPEILTIPFFSRCQYKVYDSKSNMLLPRKSSRFIGLIKKYLPVPRRWLTKLNKLRLTEKQLKEIQSDKNMIPLIENIMNEHGLSEGRDYSIEMSNQLNGSALTYAYKLYLLDTLMH